MEEKSLEDLKKEADELGIEYKGNIGKAKLSEKIEEYYDNESKASSQPVEVIDEDEEEEEYKTPEVKAKEVKAKRRDKRAEAIIAIRAQEKANRDTQVVKISMVDKREASTATHAYFSTGNVAMSVPLDVWVEMPKILIKQAERSKGLTHIEADGVTIPKETRRYVIEYKR